ncbi:MAG: hypothetical protein LDL26_10145 [Caenispirillum bisanense]|nr:hypothetical protein [Caenispirillum bisanense]MCA1974100.1 hypothetical protein [Caenispirillum sp.]
MYLDIKGSLFGSIPFDNDFTHMLFGMVVLLVTAIVFRRPVGQWATLLPVVLISAAMELVDVLIYGQAAGAAARDFVTFCLIPAVLVLSFRQGWAKA